MPSERELLDAAIAERDKLSVENYALVEALRETHGFLQSEHQCSCISCARRINNNRTLLAQYKDGENTNDKDA